MKRRWLALPLLLAACTPTAPQAGNATAGDDVTVSIPGPDTVIAAGILPTPELDGLAVTAGRWGLDANPAGDTAVFRDSTGHVLFAIRCGRAQRRWLFVIGAAAGAGSSMKIITGSGAASYPAMPRAFAPGTMARAPIDDPFIATALAQARGSFGVMLGNRTALVMPLDRVVGDVIKGCSGIRQAQSS